MVVDVSIALTPAISCEAIVFSSIVQALGKGVRRTDGDLGRKQRHLVETFKHGDLALGGVSRYVTDISGVRTLEAVLPARLPYFSIGAFHSFRLHR